MQRKLPNFLVVGAAKCGTSSLHYYLNQHPDVFMPTYTDEGLKVKEPRFLIKEKVKNRIEKGVWDFDDYNSLFDNVVEEKAIGESTVLYLFYYEEAIKNIKKYLIENVRIIIMLRNPIDRAYSAYLFASRTHQENQTFECALESSSKRFKQDTTLSPMILYKELGLYYKMVKAYFDNFKNVHVILYDDFVISADKEVSKVLDFLNIDNKNVHTNKIINSGGKQWDSKLMKKILMGNSKMKSFIKNLVPESIRVKLKKGLTNTFTSKAARMKDSTKKELLNYYQNDIKLLEKLINKDLSKWLKI